VTEDGVEVLTARTEESPGAAVEIPVDGDGKEINGSM